MNHLTESEPPRGIALEEAPGILRVVAPNPGPMTYHGTNTWIIRSGGGTVVLDPGPDDQAHLEAVRRAAGTIDLILVSHTHRDHADGVAMLAALSGAPVWGAAPHAAAPGYAPARVLADGESVLGLTAVATPGHIVNHLAFATDAGHLFSADHVMGWSTTVVIPPDGDMATYLASLDLLLARQDAVYLPGHGPSLPEPRAYVAALKAHRLKREASLLSALAAGPATIDDLVARVYAGLDPRLVRAAAASATAHLIKCEREERVARVGGLWLLCQP